MARNKELNEKLKDERRDLILTTALSLFASRGLAATKITDIAKAANMSQGLLYHYYSSKEEIFTELVIRAFERLVAASRGLESDPSPPADKIKMAIKALLEGFENSKHAANYYLLIAHAELSNASPDEAKTAIQRYWYIPYQIMEGIMRKGQQDGTIKNHDPAEMAQLFWNTINGIAMYRAMHPDIYRSPDINILSGMFLKE